MSRSSSPSSVPDPLQAVWSDAIKQYELSVGEKLRKSELWDRIVGCRTGEDICVILEEQENYFTNFRIKGQGFRAALRPLIGLVGTLSGTVGEAVGSSIPCGKAIFVAIGTLLKVAGQISEAYDSLEHIFSKLKSFLDRVIVHITPITLVSGGGMYKILIQILTQLLCVLALVTKYLGGKTSKRRFLGWIESRFPKRIQHYWHSLVGNTEVQDALKRLDELTGNELNMAVAEARQAALGAEIAARGALAEAQNANAKIAKIEGQLIDGKIIEWLSSPDLRANHDSLRRQRGSEPSANWLFSRADYLMWRQTASGVYWIHGKPGSGKSVLCSSLIDYIDATELLSSFFYFNFRDSRKQNTRDLLASLVYQFSLRSPAIHSRLTAFHSKHTQASHAAGPADQNTLLQCLYDILHDYTDIFIILDGLDEWPDSNDSDSRLRALPPLLSNLRALGKLGARLLITSRPEQDIRDLISGLASPADTAQLNLHEAKEQREMIQAFVSSEFARGTGYRDWSDEQKSQVAAALLEKSDGMFIWVTLQLNILSKTRPKDIADVMKSLPRTLDETYERILAGIPTVLAKYTRRIFQCIAFAERPLSVEELAEAFVVDFDLGTDTRLYPEHRPLDPEASVLEACSSLVQVEQSWPWVPCVVQFVHFSVKEYLCSDRLSSSIQTFRIHPIESHITLSKLCLSALPGSTTFSQQPFHPYARQHWDSHVSPATEEAVEEALLCFLGSSSAPCKFPRWDHMKRRGFGPSIGPSFEGDLDPLYVAAYLGLVQTARLLLSTSQRLTNTSNKPLPLCGAAFGGHPSTLLLLLSNGAHVNAQDYDGASALHCAISARSGHVDVVELLLEHGASLSIQDDQGCTALHCAAQSGRVDFTQLLMERGASVSVQDNDGRTPLHYATEVDVTDLVELLIKEGASASIQDNMGWTVLHLMARSQNIALAQMLVELGERQAVMNIQAHDGTTALHLAAQSRNLHVVQLLREHGATVDIQDAAGKTALHYAAQLYPEQIDVVSFLIESGASVCIQANGGWTALHYTVRSCSVNGTRLLIKRGASTIIDAQTCTGMTALHCASLFNFVDIARDLVDSGASLDIEDEEGKTALHHAARSGCLEIAQLLIQHGALISSQSKDGETALHCAAQSSNIDLARLLIEHGAPVSVQACDGRTALHYAAESSCGADIAQLLICHGVSVNTPASDGKTALHYAVNSYRSHDIVKLLVDHGASTGAQANDGQTPLHYAVEARRHEIVKLLIEHGEATGINIQNSEGRTILHYVARSGSVTLARLLITHGASVDVSANDGLTPLHFAVEAASIDVAMLLIQYGASTSIKANDGCTPLHYAARDGHEDVARLLIAHNVPVDDRDDSGWTPLHRAAWNGYCSFTRLLLEHGAIPGVQDMLGLTPLHLAVAGGYRNVAELLLAHGAPLESRSSYGATVLHWAVHGRNVEIIELLLEHGLMLATLCDADGLTPLFYAFVLGQIDVARVLLGAHRVTSPDVTPYGMVSDLTTRRVKVDALGVEQPSIGRVGTGAYDAGRLEWSGIGEGNSRASNSVRTKHLERGTPTIVSLLDIHHQACRVASKIRVMRKVRSVESW